MNDLSTGRNFKKKKKSGNLNILRYSMFKTNSEKSHKKKKSRHYLVSTTSHGLFQDSLHRVACIDLLSKRLGWQESLGEGGGGYKKTTPVFLEKMIILMMMIVITKRKSASQSQTFW